MKVLFLCTGNACRSQMAEGFARHLFGDRISAYSAGTDPRALDPRAVAVMAEAGVDIAGQRSKHVRELAGTDFDLVVTVCGHAEEHCPAFPTRTRILHAGFDDPPALARGAGSEEEARAHYRRVRDEIHAFVAGLPALGDRAPRRLTIFERYLTLWVALCIVAGIALGKTAPSLAAALDSLAIRIGDAPIVSIPIAVCLFFMMYPIMVKIDFGNVLRRESSVKPVLLTLLVNWAIKPFTMVAISTFFLGTVFRGLIGPEAVDHLKLPVGLDLAVGAVHGAGRVVLVDGMKMLEVPLWRSYLAGCILLGVAPCTAMVLVWGYLARGSDGHTLVMVAVNSLTMLILYGPLGGYLLGVGRLPVPWQALFLSIAIYVALPLAAGYLTRRRIIASKGEVWFRERFLHLLTPVTIVALLVTLVLLFSLKGEVIASRPLTILWIAIPLFVQTSLVFWLAYALARGLRLRYEFAAPAALIGASNHFEVAIATATLLFGLASGAALATVVGVLIEVPVMLLLVRICLASRRWFAGAPAGYR